MDWFLYGRDLLHKRATLREKCPYSEFLLSVFSRIRTIHGEILNAGKYPNTETSKCAKIWIRKTPNMDTFHAALNMRGL